MIRRFLVNAFLRLSLKPLWHTMPSVARVRRRFSVADRLSTLGRRTPPVRHEQVDGIRIEWFGRTPDVTQDVIFYLHGGAFALRGTHTDRRFCTDMARGSALPVVSVAYRLAPECPFPAGLDDCCRVYARSPSLPAWFSRAWTTSRQWRTQILIKATFAWRLNSVEPLNGDEFTGAAHRAIKTDDESTVEYNRQQPAKSGPSCTMRTRNHFRHYQRLGDGYAL